MAATTEAISLGSGHKSICHIHPNATEWAEFDSFPTLSRKGVQLELQINICAICAKEGTGPTKYQFELNLIKDDEDVGTARIFYGILDGRNWLMGRNLTYNFMTVTEWFRDSAVSNDRTLEKLLFQVVDQLDEKYFNELT